MRKIGEADGSDALPDLQDLQARVVQLEHQIAARGDDKRALSMRTTCQQLGPSIAQFYKVEQDLRRLGLVELVRLTSRRRFDAASVARVRVRR